MPYIPLVDGRKQCPRCGDSLFIVRSIFVSAKKVAKASLELEKLLSRSHPDGLGQPCQVGRKLT